MKYKTMFFFLFFSLFFYYDTIICIIAIISIIAYDNILKWQLFLMMMIVANAIPTRKSDSLSAHKHLLHCRSNTSPGPLDCRFHLLVQCVSVPYSLCILYSLYTLYSLFSIPQQVRRHIVHTLLSGGGQHVGFDAVD